MKTKNLIVKGLFLTLFAGALFTSCNKKAEIEAAANNDEATASNSEEADATGNEASNIADAAAKTGGSVVGRSGAASFADLSEAGQCATITHDTTSGIHALTIDFGSSNCVCNDGRTRRGKILVTYTGGYFDIGSVKTMTFDNFYRNDNHIEGTRTITNKGLNDLGHYHWEIKAVNMKITKTDNKVHTWNSTRDREMLAGYDTKVWSDDEYQITGTADGTNHNGVTYTATITTPLHRNMSCKFIDKGIIEFENAKGGKRTLDFGNGSCDSQATVTVTTKRGKTTTKQITLK